MKLARSLSVFLALAMLLCIFSACKEKEDEQQAGGEPQTLSKADLFTESGASYTFTCSIDGNVATILKADANDPDWANRIEIAFDQNGNATEDIYNDEGAVIRHVEYNEAGKDTLLIWYDGEGNMYFRQESTYDENGNLTVKKGADFRLGNVVESHLEYEYDANGNEIKRTSYDAGKVKSVTEYEYDANGNETKEIVNGAVFSEHVYDENGNLLKEIRSGSVRAEYEYDENGNLLKEIADGSVKSEREYDGNGRLTKHTSYNEDGTVSFYSITEYDGNGSRTQSTYQADGTLMGVNVFDPDGNQIKQTVNNIDGTVAYVMELEYDANGNVTKRVNDGIVRAEFAYNENGQRTKQFLYEPDGSFRWGYEITEYTTANLTRAQADFLFDRLLQELMS